MHFTQLQVPKWLFTQGANASGAVMENSLADDAGVANFASPQINMNH